jgi:adenylyltransferase/sulfurtransferase
MGVFAPLTGVIGAMQAAEAIKLVAAAGESLSGRLVMFDAKSADWRSVRVKRDPRLQGLQQPIKTRSANTAAGR